jgi:hypothetical protein
MRWLMLGLRLTRGAGRAGLIRAALMATGTAVGAVVLLAVLAAPGVVRAQQERAKARNPVPAWACVYQCFGLRLGERDDAIGTRQLRRVAVAIDTAVPADRRPIPPGLSALPRPGEALVSPALADLLRTDPRARARFPQRVVGLIGRAGLVAPDELRAYVGVPANDPFMENETPVLRFGGEDEPQPFAADQPRPQYDLAGLALPAVALFVVAPVAVFVGTCARLSSTARDVRLAALRLLGVSARQAVAVTAVETAVVATVGAITGTAVFAALRPLSQSWHLGRLHWYASDIAVPPVTGAATLAGLIVAAVAVSVLAVRSDRVGPLRVRVGGAPARPNPSRVWPLAAGMVLTAVGGAPAAMSDFFQVHEETIAQLSDELLPLGLLLVAGGLAVILPLVTWHLAGLVRRLPGAPLWLELAAARLRMAPAVAPRLVSTLVVTVLALGLGWIGAGVALGDRTFTLVDRFWRPAATYWTPTDDPALESALRALPGVRVADIRGGVTVQVDDVQAAAIVTTCAELLVAYSLDPGQSCVDGKTYRLETLTLGEFVADPALPAGEIAYTWSFDQRGNEVSDGRMEVPSTILRLTPVNDSQTRASILITRDAPIVAGRTLTTGGMHLAVADRAALDRASATVSARTPANYLWGDLGARRGYDASLLLTLLLTGLGLALGLGLATFAVAAVDHASTRRKESVALAVVGAPARTVTAADLAAGGLPLAIGLVLAAASTVALTIALAGRAGLAPTAALAEASTAAYAGIGTFAVGLVLLAAVALASRRRRPASAQRRTGGL